MVRKCIWSSGIDEFSTRQQESPFQFKWMLPIALKRNRFQLFWFSVAPQLIDGALWQPLELSPYTINNSVTHCSHGYAR